MALPPRAALISRPFAGYHYWVELKGMTEALFSECTGLQIETEIFEYKEGGVNTHIHRLPVRTKFGNITLKKGVARPSARANGKWDSALWDWHWNIVHGKIIRHSFSIVLRDPNYPTEETARWNIVNAFPVKWVGPSWKSSDNAVAIETLELAHQGIRLA
ncbi:MAG: phage tail protein [Chloroflexi bacterium]|nr:phage tail protein [Chloroflexota bacterium]